MRRNIAFLSAFVMLVLSVFSVSDVLAQSPVETADFNRTCSVIASGGSGAGTFDYYFTLSSDALAGVSISFMNDNSHPDWLVGHYSLTRVSDGTVIVADSGFGGGSVSRNYSHYMAAGQYKLHFWPQGSSLNISDINVSSCDIDAMSRSCPLIFEAHGNDITSGALSLAGTDTYIDVYRYRIGSNGYVGHISFGSLLNYDLLYRAGNTRDTFLVHGADGAALTLSGYGTNHPYYVLARVYDCGLPPTATPTVALTPTVTPTADIFPSHPGCSLSFQSLNSVPDGQTFNILPGYPTAFFDYVGTGGSLIGDTQAVLPSSLNSVHSTLLSLNSSIASSIIYTGGGLTSVRLWVCPPGSVQTPTPMPTFTPTPVGTPPPATPWPTGVPTPVPGSGGWSLPTPMPMGEAYSFSNNSALEFLSFFVTFLHAMNMYWPIVITMMLMLAISILMNFIKR